jgi:hypothetical protein
MRLLINRHVIRLAFVLAAVATAGAEPKSEVRSAGRSADILSAYVTRAPAEANPNPTTKSRMGASGTARSAAPGGNIKEAVVEKLYVSKCAKCHKFYDPAKYSDSQWAKWMGKMGKKAKLSPEQQKELSEYIQGKYRSNANATLNASH